MNCIILDYPVHPEDFPVCLFAKRLLQSAVDCGSTTPCCIAAAFGTYGILCGYYILHTTTLYTLLSPHLLIKRRGAAGRTSRNLRVACPAASHIFVGSSIPFLSLSVFSTLFYYLRIYFASLIRWRRISTLKIYVVVNRNGRR